MADFRRIALSLQAALVDFYGLADGEAPEPALGATIATNSELVARRAEPLLWMLAAGGVDGVAGRRVLDLGCGFGAISLFLAARGAEAIGIDPHGERLELGRRVAAEHRLSARFATGRMEALELDDRDFDVVVQNNSLCYVVDSRARRAALAETLRVLRPGGALVSRNPNRWHPLDQFTDLPLLQLLPPSTAVRAAALAGRRRSLCHVLSPPAARRELRRAGFVDIVQPGFPAGPKPDALKLVARYQHFTARRPATAVAK